ncbi:hypothetical protein [Rhodococcus sp. ANT_H53B]|uniref:hypothetical protein n=1 Tax=Rhodococcus sp. ANT_H53B TaxID=2597357 RepID=UPI0011EE0CBE|nr:hypothetical protein [Rhodococcus sp. ANT_H53B]
MSHDPEPGTPARRFMDDMAAAGALVHAEEGRLMFEVDAVGGAMAGHRVTTGVSVSEVQNWPQIPPHWVHLPDTVVFTETNSDEQDCPPGWKRHSRDFGEVDTSVPLALAWIRHVRGLLTLAISNAA